MSIAQARNEVKGKKKGSRKDPPQIPSLGDHMHTASIFLINTGNCAHRNNLSSGVIGHGIMAGNIAC